MSVGQTSVNSIGQPYAYAGLVADNGPVDKVSGVSVEASNSIPFGCAVMQDPSSQQGMLNPTSAIVGSPPTNALKGILAQTFEHAPGLFGDIDSAGAGLVPLGRGDVIRKGRIWVVLDSNLTIKPFFDRGYCRYSANGGNTQIGAWSNASDAGHNADFTRNCVFVSTAQLSSDGSTYIAQLEVDLTISNIAENAGD